MLIVDGIVVEDVDLHYYLNSALSNGFYLVEIFSFEMMRVNRDISMKKLRSIEQCSIDEIENIEGSLSFGWSCGSYKWIGILKRTVNQDGLYG